MHTMSPSLHLHTHISPSHVHILSTLGLVMVIQGPLAPLLSLPLAIFFCDSCICFMVLPFVMVTESQQAWRFWSCFVNARFPYLFCVTFLCVLRSCSVVVHICMRVIHIFPSPSFLLLLTSQLVDVTWCVSLSSKKTEMLMPNFAFLKKKKKDHKKKKGF